MRLSALLLAPFASAFYTSRDNVKIVENVDEWSKLKKSKDPLLVEFFSRGCGHCERFAPEYVKAGNVLKGVLPVYAADDAEIAQMEKISSVPTIKFYADGKIEEYEGARTASGVANFAITKLQDVVSNRLGEKKASRKTGGGGDVKSTKKQARPGKVVELTSADFDETVMEDTQNVWFVKFYAPWCGHCKALAPTWDELAKDMEGKAKIAKVDATVETQLAQRFQVQGYPTLILFPAGKKSMSNMVRYNQARELADLSRFVMKYAEKAIKAIQLTSHEQFEELCSDKKLCFISFLPHILDSSAKERKGYLKTLKQLAISKAGLPITYLWTEAGNSLELERALRLEFGWPATLIINKAKGFYAIHRGGFKENDLSSFVDKVSMGRISGETLPDPMPKFPTLKKWDGKDAPKEEL